MTLLALAVAGRGLVDPDEPAVHADDEGFLRGRGAFETARVYGGRPFRLREHLARLDASARRLGLVPPDTAELEELAAQAVAAASVPDAVLRLYYTPGREGAERPVSFALVAALPPELEEERARGLGLATVTLPLEPPWLLGGVKSTSYALNMVAVDEAKRRGADDALFLARDGTVLEGPTTNVWWRRGQTLFTPALELGVLDGITSAALAGEAPRLGYVVEAGTYAVAELAGADEAFTSSSVREVMPVVALDGRTLGGGEPGPAARALQQELRRLACAS